LRLIEAEHRESKTLKSGGMMFHPTQGLMGGNVPISDGHSAVFQVLLPTQGISQLFI
jgi:hypothetical protein